MAAAMQWSYTEGNRKPALLLSSKTTLFGNESNTEVELSRTLVLFTATYPFGKGEAFLESEFPFLEQAFERIIIITTNLTATESRPLAPHIQVIRLSYEASGWAKTKALTAFFSSPMAEEWAFAKSKTPQHLAACKVMVNAYAKAIELQRVLEELVAKYQIPLSELYLYSYWMNNICAGVALFKKKHGQVKAFTRAHGWDLYFERHNPPYLPFRHFILQHLDACYCISQNGADYLNAVTAGKYSDKIRLSRLGTFNSTAALSSESDTPVIVSCSNVIALKRVHLIVEALATCNRPVQWIHFGSGPLLHEMKQLATKLLDTNPHIKYTFKGQVSNTDVLNYYRTNPVSLFMNVSETEGLPVSIMEAMSFGIPVIATNVGGVAEIVEDGVNGFMLPANPSVNEVAQAINHFIALPPEKATGLRRAAFETWNEKYNAAKNYPEFVKKLLLK